ncbi:hypothetical protein [Chthonobacter albigriseus]|uniref:hypothetical protein n=1 Tax=Chthonobacter albigriseus TaxID=1683161 RepID=UPI0015EFB0B4|nr:hypothetical protein [Chthonobacter albigriseus]
MRHEIFPDVVPTKAHAVAEPLTALTRRDRLRRWATVLEAHTGPVRALQRIEYLTPDERRALRDEASPLAVAFADPVLRAAGLRSDSLGDAVGFFELTDEQAHHLLCDCHYHGAMTPNGVSARIRAIADRRSLGDLWTAVRGWFGGRPARTA